MAVTQTFDPAFLLRQTKYPNMGSVTHVAIAFGPSDLRVFEDGRPIKTSKNTAATVRRFTGAMDLSGDAYLGGSPATFGW